MLRRAIAQRGALRHVLFVCGIGIWALTLTVVLIWLRTPLACFVPLLVLFATFEAIRPLHFGAERIGRYLQVFYEEDGEAERVMRDTPSWERVAMRFGSVPGVGGHPLFLPVFILAIAVNSLAATYPRPPFADYVLITVVHVVFGGWVFSANRAMKKQREIELDRMRYLFTK